MSDEMFDRDDDICDLTFSLACALRDVLDTYRQGHNFTLATAVGVLEVLKAELIYDVFKKIDEDEADTDTTEEG